MRDDGTLGAQVRHVAERMMQASIPATEHDVMAELQRLGLTAWATDNRLEMVVDEMAAIDREDNAIAAAICRDISAGRTWSLIGTAHAGVLVTAFALADLWGRGWI